MMEIDLITARNAQTCVTTLIWAVSWLYGCTSVCTWFKQEEAHTMHTSSLSYGFLLYQYVIFHHWFISTKRSVYCCPTSKRCSKWDDCAAYVVCICESMTVFRRRLKTELFSRSFPDWLYQCLLNSFVTQLSWRSDLIIIIIIIMSFTRSTQSTVLTCYNDGILTVPFTPSFCPKDTTIFPSYVFSLISSGNP